VINKATFEEIAQTRGSSAAAIQFSFRNRANFHSRFPCYQCVFDPVPLSTSSLFSCAFAFSSNLICWRPKEMYHALKISVTVAAFIILKGLIYNCILWNASKRTCQFAVDEISMLKRKIEQSETSVVRLQAHTEKGTCPRDSRYAQKQTSLLTKIKRQQYTP